MILSPDAPLIKRELKVPFGVISAVTQQRSDMKDIHALADNIGEQGLLTPIWVALLEGDAAAEVYLQGINQVFAHKNANHTLAELDSFLLDGKKYYVIIIAGHRRYNALRLLAESGCDSWKAQFPKKSHTRVWKQKYSQLKVDAYLNIDPIRALELQLTENSYSAPRITDTIDTTKALWEALKIKKPKLTLKAFAAFIGVSEQVARERIVFHDALPLVKAAVYDERISFGCGLLLLNYQRKLAAWYGNRIDAEEQVQAFIYTWLRLCMLEKFTQKALLHHLKKEYGHIIVGQQSLYDMFDDSEDQRALAERSAKQLRQARLLTEHLRATAGWLDNVRWLKRYGLMEAETSAWRLAVVRATFSEALDNLQGFLRDMEQDLIESDLARADAIVAKGRKALASTKHLVVNPTGN